MGWKLGYTSLAMRIQMEIDHPNFGPLTDAMLLANDEAVSPSLIQPCVEPEIVLRLAQPLSDEVSVGEVLSAVDEAFACLEIVDSVYPNYRFRLEDNTADGSSHRSWSGQPFVGSWPGRVGSFVPGTTSSPAG